MLKGVTVMLVTYSWWRWCWWASFDVGEIFWILVPDVNIEKGCMLVAKMVKTVINIVELSPTHFVFNIRHQHQCNRWQRQQYVGDFIMLIDLKCWQNYFFQCKESVINILNLSTIHFISNIDVTVKLALIFFQMRIFSCVSNFVQHPILGHTQEDKDETIRSKFLIFIMTTFLEYRFTKIRILKIPWFQIYLWHQTIGAYFDFCSKDRPLSS